MERSVHNMAFKENLRRLREERGFLSRRSFAIKTLGIEYTTYNGYEVRGTLPPEELIIKIAKVLNVSIDELFGYDSTTNETDIDITIKELNRMGIKAVLEEERREVGIYLNKITRFTGIPYERAIEIVKTAKSVPIVNVVNNHIIYSLVMKNIIGYVNGRTTSKKSAKSIPIDVTSPTASQDLLNVGTKVKAYTKKERTMIKRFLNNTED